MKQVLRNIVLRGEGREEEDRRQNCGYCLQDIWQEFGEILMFIMFPGTSCPTIFNKG